jgi:hypothetical protein
MERYCSQNSYTNKGWSNGGLKQGNWDYFKEGYCGCDSGGCNCGNRCLCSGGKCECNGHECNREGCGCRNSSNHESRSTEWTVRGNATPGNSPKYNTFTPTKEGYSAPPAHSEGFNVNLHNTYSNLNHTWVRQKPYTSG